MTRPRVLFVDDEQRILDGLRRSLRGRRREWEMAFVTSGAEALELLAQVPYDVVISDMRMPRMDGAELLTQISRAHPEVARVVLSGHTEPAAAFKVAIAGHRFLTKPSDVAHVEGIITELTARPGAIRVQPRPQAAPPLDRVHLDAAGDPDRAGGLDEAEERWVRRSAGMVRSLPTPPGQLDAVSAVLTGPDIELTRVIRAVTHNVGLTAKFLQLSNSPFFTSRPRVVAIDSAVNAVGLPTIQGMAGTGELLWAASAPLSDTVRHAIATADVVGLLASPGNRPYAQAAAVLQDVGRFVCVGDHRGDLSTRAVGVELLRLWGLPAPVVAAVARRDEEHHPDAAGLGVAAAVRAAHLLVQRTDARDPAAGLHDTELDRLLAHPQVAGRSVHWLDAAERAVARAAQWAPETDV